MANEKRLIDFEKAKKSVMQILAGKVTTVTAVKVAVAMQDASVDAVPVVRCKDCTNFERKFPGYGYCYHWDCEPGMSPNEVEEDDFCSCGERITNGTAQV